MKGDLAQALGSTAPEGWFFHCKPERGEPFEADGFADEFAAMAAAEAYAMSQHGPAPGYRVMLYVGRDSQMVPSCSTEWPMRARDE
jgi:hypothetical protein